MESDKGKRMSVNDISIKTQMKLFAMFLVLVFWGLSYAGDDSKTVNSNKSEPTFSPDHIELQWVLPDGNMVDVELEETGPETIPFMLYNSQSGLKLYVAPHPPEGQLTKIELLNKQQYLSGSKEGNFLPPVQVYVKDLSKTPKFYYKHDMDKVVDWRNSSLASSWNQFTIGPGMKGSTSLGQAFVDNFYEPITVNNLENLEGPLFIRATTYKDLDNSNSYSVGDEMTNEYMLELKDLAN
jgi:hypothetical protein